MRINRFPNWSLGFLSAIVFCNAVLVAGEILLLSGDLPCYAEPVGASTGDQAMKDDTLFTYKQTGGFMGVNRLYEQNLSQLPKPEMEKLDRLVRESGLMKAPEKKTNPRACDVYIYDFSFTQAGKTYQAVFDDTTLPASYRPLVEYLKDKVKDQKRG
jgi:hypothetical protein